MLPVCPLQVRICDTACHTWQMERAEEIPIFLINMLKINVKAIHVSSAGGQNAGVIHTLVKLKKKEYHTRYTSIF